MGHRKTTPRPPVPTPRNTVEIPLYVFCEWGVWSPIQLLLGVPYRDLDDRFAAPRARVVSVDPLTRRRMDGRVDDGVPTHRVRSRTNKRVGFVISSGRSVRRGPRRASGAIQNIIDIGIHLPTKALAWMVVWRDLGIEARNLGTELLATQHEGWWRSLPQREANVRKHRERFLAAGASGRPSPMMPSDRDALRTAAVIASRGAAAYTGGAEAGALLDAAFARYRPWDAELEAIALPATDVYRYHPDVRKIAPYFAAAGAELCTYGGETTHLIVHEPVDDEAEEKRSEVVL